MIRIATAAVFAVFGVSLLTSCGSTMTELKLQARSYQSLDREQLESIFFEQTSFQLDLVSGLPGESGIDALAGLEIFIVNGSEAALQVMTLQVTKKPCTRWV